MHIECNHDGNVELYFDNSKKFETTSAGSKVTGNLEVTGSISGAIGQALQYHNDGRTVCSGTSWNGVASQAITPASTSSKILVMTSACFGMDSNNANLTYMIAKFILVWNHSGISETQLGHKAYGLNFPEDQGMDKIFQGNCNIIYLHSPNTTNPITYTLQGRCHHSSSTLEVTRGGTGEDDKSITLLEIL